MKRLFAILTLLALLFTPALCGGTSSAKRPGTVSQTSGYGTDWSNTVYIKTDDTYFASNRLGKAGSGNNESEYLIATNFGFAIPSTMTIIGIEVSLARYADGTNCVTTETIDLYYDGSGVGTSKNEPYYYWPASEESKTFGSSSDLWGWSSASPSYVNSSTFGVRIRIYNPNCTTYEPTGYIDYVKITVYYTDGWTGKVISVTNPAKIIGKAKDAVKKVLGTE